MGKYLDKEGVKHLWGKIKALVDNAKRDAINAARYTLPAANGSTLGGVKSGEQPSADYAAGQIISQTPTATTT